MYAYQQSSGRLPLQGRRSSPVASRGERGVGRSGGGGVRGGGREVRRRRVRGGSGVRRRGRVRQPFERPETLGGARGHAVRLRVAAPRVRTGVE